MVRFLRKNIDLVLFVHLKNQGALEQHWVFFRWMWEYMHSYNYFTYSQNINFQRVLPQAFAKSLETKIDATKIVLVYILNVIS